MNILFSVNNDKKVGGPENWRRLMCRELGKSNNVEQVYTLNLVTIYKSVMKAEIVQTYVSSGRTLLVMILAKILGKKIVHKISGNYYTENSDKTGIKRLFWLPVHMFCTEFADVVTFPSVYMKNCIIERNPRIRSKSVVIPNGVDINKFVEIKPFIKEDLGIQSNSLLLVEVTNFDLMDKARGIDILVKSFFDISSSAKKYLFIVGGGKYLSEYQKKYESEYIRFLGQRSDAVRFIKTCDMFVHFSLLDNFPNVLLEAMACNKPIQALPVGGIPEMIPLECLTKGDIKLDVKADYRKKLDMYSIASVGSEFVKLYESLI